MGRLPDGNCKVISDICIPLMPSQISGCGSPRCSPSLSHAAHPHYSGWGGEKWISLAAFCIAGEPGHSLTCFHFPLWEKSWTMNISFDTELCCIWEGVRQVKQNCSSYPLQCVQSQIFFFYSNLLEAKTSTKELSSIRSLSKLMFFGGDSRKCIFCHFDCKSFSKYHTWYNWWMQIALNCHNESSTYVCQGNSYRAS